MNPEHASYRNIVIKLAYVLDEAHPDLKLFVNDEVAQAREWATYGVEPLEQYEHLEHALHFHRIGERQTLAIAGLELEIEYSATGTEEYDYPRTGRTRVPYFEFSITSRPLADARGTPKRHRA